MNTQQLLSEQADSHYEDLLSYSTEDKIARITELHQQFKASAKTFKDYAFFHYHVYQASDAFPLSGSFPITEAIRDALDIASYVTDNEELDITEEDYNAITTLLDPLKGYGKDKPTIFINTFAHTLEVALNFYLKG